MKSTVKNNWYVVTGAPSSGKTTLLARLEKKGHRVVFEAARQIIDEDIEKGKTVEEIRKDELAFQKRVLALKVARERELRAGDTIFFERGIPDSTAYYELCGVLEDDVLAKANEKSVYKVVFLLDMLSYRKDYARTENATVAEHIAKLLEKAYKQLGFHIVKVPVMSIDKRIEFILKHIEI